MPEPTGPETAGRVRSRVFAVLAATMLLLSVVASPAQGAATNVYVDIDSTGGPCSDARPASQAGDPATPWCGLARAVAAAPDEATVHVRAGSYPKLTVVGQQTRTAGITIRPYGNEDVALAGLLLERTNAVEVRNLRITASTQIGPYSHDIGLVENRITPGGVRVDEGTTDLQLVDNHLTVPNGNGVIFSAVPPEPPVERVTIRGNRFENIGIVGVNARHFKDVVVEENEFSGVHSWNGTVHPDVIRTYNGGTNLTIRRNFLHDNAAQGVFIKDGVVTNVDIENNVIVRTSGFYAINLYTVKGVRIVNNTVADNSYGVVFQSTATNAVLRNNILDSINITAGTIFEVEDHNFVARGNPGGRGPNNVKVQPTYVDKAALDYRLAPGSSAIGTGSVIGAPASDRLGAARSLVAGHVDLGAHAYTVAEQQPAPDPDPPVEPVEPPVDPDPPVEPVEPPVEPDPPVEPPVDPDPPVEPPVPPVDPPVVPAAPPVVPVDPPVITVDPPVVPAVPTVVAAEPSRPPAKPRPPAVQAPVAPASIVALPPGLAALPRATPTTPATKPRSSGKRADTTVLRAGDAPNLRMRVTLNSSTAANQLRAGRLRTGLRCTRDCRVTGWLVLRRGTRTVRVAIKATLRAGDGETVVIVLSSKARRLLKSAQPATAVITLAARDDDGERTTTERTLKLT